MNIEQGSLGSQKFCSNVPTTNTMAGTEIKVPIFNGNGLDDPKQHWFICEVVWIVRQIQYENIKKAQMIMTL